jgi:hypothetical protein
MVAPASTEPWRVARLARRKDCVGLTHPPLSPVTSLPVKTPEIWPAQSGRRAREETMASRGNSGAASEWEGRRARTQQRSVGHQKSQQGRDRRGGLSRHAGSQRPWRRTRPPRVRQRAGLPSRRRYRFQPRVRSLASRDDALRGRVRRQQARWRLMGASLEVLKWIREGKRLQRS